VIRIVMGMIRFRRGIRYIETTPPPAPSPLKRKRGGGNSRREISLFFGNSDNDCSCTLYSNGKIGDKDSYGNDPFPARDGKH